MTGTVNRDQYAAWNGDSGLRWAQDATRRDRVLRPIADLLLARASIEPAEAVLDVGCGCGATTIAAAETTGNKGAVVGIDLSRPMLDIAETRRANHGLDNIALVHGDAQTVQLGSAFDVAVSRFGTMFYSDPTTAFTNIAAHLRPGGRLCISTWQPLLDNQWLVVPGGPLLRYGELPDTADPDSPGMFAQSDPDTITKTLDPAGFSDISCEPYTVALNFGSTLDEAVAYLADSGPGRAVLETIPPDARPAALREVRRQLAPHHRPKGTILEAAIWITTAIKPLHDRQPQIDARR